MKLSNKRKLVVFTYLMENGSRPVNDIQAEFEITEDEDFPFDETLNELVKEGFVNLRPSEIIVDQLEIPKWEITEPGKIHLNDLVLDKYEEEIRMSIIIRAILIVVAILAFMMIFPLMFHP